MEDFQSTQTTTPFLIFMRSCGNVYGGARLYHWVIASTFSDKNRLNLVPPPTAVPHMVIEDDVFNGYLIPANSIIFANVK